jgi:hypothetical protein
MKSRDVPVDEGVAPEARLRPVVVCAPFITGDGYYARPGDRLRMTPEEIAERVAAHQVRPLAGDATRPVRRFIRRT